MPTARVDQLKYYGLVDISIISHCLSFSPHWVHHISPFWFLFPSSDLFCCPSFLFSSFFPQLLCFLSFPLESSQFASDLECARVFAIRFTYISTNFSRQRNQHHHIHCPHNIPGFNSQNSRNWILEVGLQGLSLFWDPQNANVMKYLVA